jgi:GNAT superfamily N-acetyltransferase
MTTALLGELSWIAVDEEANKVIGARLISDCKDVIFPSKSYGPNMDLIVSLLNHLTRYDHNLTCTLEIRAMHAHIVSVHEVYTGKKVAAELFNHATFWGKSRGYSILRGEVTSYYNYKILRNFKGFRCLNEVRYNLFETQGIKPFAGVSRPHETCIAYEIDLKDPTALETRVNYVPK